METQTLQEKVLNLKTLFQNQKFDEAEIIMGELLTDHPDYQTPLILYVQLFSTIEHDNPLYDKILQLSGHYNIWDQFPPNLIPSWYTKIQRRNLKIKTDEIHEVNPDMTAPIGEEAVVADESEMQEIDDILITPEPLAAVEEIREVITMVQPEDIMPDDLDLLIEDEPGQKTEFAQQGYTELDDLLPDMHEAEPEAEEIIKPYNTGEMFEDNDDVLATSEDLIDDSDEKDVHPDDEILVASETMAEIFVQQKKYSQALKVYRILMEEDPENFDHYFKRAQELETMGK